MSRFEGVLTQDGIVVASWSAQPTVLGDQGAHTYACEVVWEDRDGRRISQTHTLTHRERDGALALVARCLSVVSDSFARSAT